MTILLSSIVSLLLGFSWFLLRKLRVFEHEAAQLKQAFEQTESASKSKSDLLANVTHELRSPIGAILGYAELLKNHELSESEKYSHIQAVERNGRHLLDIVNDILDLSKIEAGLLEIEHVTFSLHLELLNIIATYKKDAARKGIKINMDYEFPIPECIISDPTRFRQILINLLSNSIKFTEKGSIDLSVSIKKDQLIIKVKDTGIGIKESQQMKLFQPFVQADSSVTRKFGGTGLGLSLSRRLALALEGDLFLESSEPGKGATFALRVNPGDLKSIRWLKSHTDFDNIPLPRNPEKEIIALEGLNFLIVEDSKDNQTIYLQYLESAGANVELADDGKNGYEKASQKEYDAILMDIQMPNEDGYSTTKRLRSNGYKKPILALTANAMKGERERCIESGCDDYLTKPVDPDLLVEILSWITRGRGRSNKQEIDKLKNVNYLSSIDKEALVPAHKSDPQSPSPIRSIYENDPRVANVIDPFVKGLEKKLTKIKLAVSDGNFGQVKSLAHSLRGSSATYGFPEMAAVAEKLELESRSEMPNFEHLNAHIENLRLIAFKMSC